MSNIWNVFLVCLLFATSSLLNAQTFTKVTTGAIVTDIAASRSVAWIDYDKDGDLDLFVTNGKAGGENNVLYRNDGAPSFTFTRMSSLIISQDGKPSDGATWGDYDNDGDDDAFVVNWYGINNLMYENNGDGSFTQILAGVQVNDGGYSETASWGDYNNDGYLDLYVSNSGGILNNFLYKNLGDGSFQKITSGGIVNDGGHSRGVNWVDYDNDRDLDMFVTNESNENEFLYKNLLTETGIDSFTRITTGPLVTSGGTSWSGSWGDYDNDGDLDVFVANSQNQNNNLFNNQGNGTFIKFPISFGDIVDDSGSSASAAWADIDNDGDLDLYVNNAYGPPGHNFLYKNLLIESGVAEFNKIVTGGIVNDAGYSYGQAWGDYDQDGDLDLYIAKTLSEAQANALYANDGNSNNWLTIDCKGTASNRSAIGARVKVKAVINGNPVWQIREIEGQNGYCVQTLQQHFGLETATVADSIVIDWPSGLQDVFTGVPVNQYYAIAENQSTAPLLSSPPHTATGQLPTTTLRWRKTLSGAPYRLQIATDSTFVSGIVFDDSTITDTTASVDSLPNYNTLYWRVQETRSIYKNIWSSVWMFVVGASTFNYSVNEKWNIVSVPVTVAHYDVSSLFPFASTQAYSFVNGTSYVADDTLISGYGYWIKFPALQNFQIAGVEHSPDTIDVAAGWNLIGSRGDVVPAAAISSIPDGIVHSLLFGYQQGYYSTDSITPFKGYWIKVSQAGNIILNDSVVSTDKMYVSQLVSGLNRLQIHDANGNSQTLYFSGRAGSEYDNDRYEMPPKPPTGVFDARFESGAMVEGINKESSKKVPLVFSSASFPLKIQWEIKEENINAEIVHESSITALHKTGEVMVFNENSIVTLRILHGSVVPGSFTLGQNYPNPFNPETKISFKIPATPVVGQVSGFTVLKIFDVLGREVKQLVNEELQPGSYQVSWDASSAAVELTSGVYYYRLQSGNYSETKKMLLMK